MGAKGDPTGGTVDDKAKPVHCGELSDLKDFVGGDSVTLGRSRCVGGASLKKTLEKAECRDQTKPTENGDVQTNHSREKKGLEIVHTTNDIQNGVSSGGRKGKKNRYFVSNCEVRKTFGTGEKLKRKRSGARATK